MPLDIQVETDPAGPVAPKRSFEELALKSLRVSNGHLQYFQLLFHLAYCRQPVGRVQMTV